ncbi:MAG: choice-of-anchor E domain-containing protein, partial [Chitinophagales bacterium]|nr:choice-of-anchor E domain-containing protein [Chitinophagales bacterium]
MKSTLQSVWQKTPSLARYCLKPLFVIPGLLLFGGNIAYGQVSGMVFQDFNADGVRQSGSSYFEPGQSGIVVVAYNTAGATLPVTYTGGGSATNSTGEYSVPSATIGQVRLEFVLPDGFTYASNGVSGGTTVLFPTSGTQNLAVNYPKRYCQNSPDLVTPCFVNGRPAISSANDDVIVRYPYSASGTTHAVNNTYLAQAAETGATWGIAYDRTTQYIYTSAFLKRHVGLRDNDADGKEDLGAIYRLSTSGSPVFWLDLATLGVDVGLSVMPTIAARGLPNNNLQESNDPDVFALVGKVGLGDIDISDDGKTLFVVNLYDKKVYTIDIATKLLVGSGVAIPNTCTGGQVRPFGLSYHKGKLYVGTICDALTSQSTADLSATIYRLDGGTFTSVLTYPLNYVKGAADRTTQYIYTSAFLKRHVGLRDNDADGKEDLGAIYRLSTSGSPVFWLDLATLGVDVGLSVMPTIAARGLPNNNLQESNDPDVFALVGKVGLGDIDISDDGKTLFVVNLYDKKVYTIDIATKLLVGSGVAIPNTCTGGQVRPFGLSYHKGKLYVGTICDALTSQSTADLSATIYRLDGGTFTSVLTYPLNYVKGAAFNDGTNKYGTQWNPWRDVFYPMTGFNFNGQNNPCLPQPMLVNIEFDVNDDMIMVFNDRLGHQTGTLNWGTNPADNANYYSSVSGGDLLRASWNGTTYTLENNGTVGGLTGASNSEGPGGGEFYWHDRSLNGGSFFYHEDNVAGGGTILAGTREFSVHVADPINAWSAGTFWLSNTNGQRTDSYEVYPETYNVLLFGKANGLGDLELLCNSAPLEIGNRVWADTDNDGVQDPGEAGISGVEVTLWKESTPGNYTQVATVTTDANGRYYFSNATGTSTMGITYDPDVQPNMNYQLRFPTTSGALSISSKVNMGGGDPYADARDTDASAAGIISFSTANLGENNHTYDVAYAACTAPTLTTIITHPGCSPANNGAINLSLTGGSGTTFTYDWSNDGAETPDNDSQDLSGLVAGTYTVTVTSDGGCTATISATLNTPAPFTVTPTPGVCHANGTPESAADDFINFDITITNAPQSSQLFTVTATQNGNPITIQLANGGAANAVNCGLRTPLRTLAATAGQGNIVITVTDNLTGCTQTATITDPGSCAAACVPGTPSMAMYSYRTQFDITDLNYLPIEIPQFDDQGGSRTLTSVKLDYEVGFTTAAVMENRAANPQTYNATFSCDAYIDLGVNTIANPSLSVATGPLSFVAGIIVPAQGTYPGDVTPPLPAPQVPSTLAGMQPWLIDEKLDFFKDPLSDPRWVTNATGNPTHDDDMAYFPPSSDSDLGSITYNTVATMAPFVGSGSVPLTVSTLTGISSSGGGGNITVIQRTRAYAYAKVTYTYECAAVPCDMTALTAIPGACDPNTNTYNLSGQLTFSNPPSTGELSIRVPGQASVKFFPPFTSPINYSIGPLNSDMGNYNVVATFSADPTCTISTAFAAPPMCLAITPACAANETEGFEVYTDVHPITTTNFSHTFTGIPQFNTMGGTRTLKKVLVSFQQSMRVSGVMESTDAAPSSMYIETNGSSTFKLSGNTVGSLMYSFVGADVMVGAGVPVPPQGTWAGDVAGSTLFGMGAPISNDLINGVDPTTNPVWVTNQTGNPVHDDDIAYFPPYFQDNTSNLVFTNALDLTQFTGAGAVDLAYMVMAASNGMGSGNFNTMIRTRAAANVYVKYIYCEVNCTAPTLTTAPSNPGCPAATNGSINLTVTGGSGTSFTYDWSNDGAETPDNDLEDLSGVGAGTYTVTVTSNDGCSATTSATLNDPAPLNLNLTPIPATTCVPVNGAVALTVTGGTGAYTYDWSNDGEETPDNDFEDLTGVAPGTYTVTVTDANGCTATNSATVGGPTGPSVNVSQVNVLCFGASTGALDITASGGTGAYSYAWSDLPGSPDPEDRTGLPAGTYTVTVTDGASCTVSATYMLTQPTTAVSVVVSGQTNILCFGASTGAIDITATGGTGAYTYAWSDLPGSPDPEDRSGLPQGTYTVTVTDANNCTATVSATLTQPTAAISINVSQTNILCFGASTGAIDITATGGTGAYTYAWSDLPGSPDPEDRTGLPQGTYTVTVTDANNCTGTRSVTLTQPSAAVSVSGIPINSTNCITPNGAINITASGGTGAYTYAWADLQGSPDPEDRSGLAPGTYTVTVTDANNCTATNSFTVAPPPSPSVVVSGTTNILCFGESTGAIDITASGGTGTYTYAWSDLPGSPDPEDRTGIPAGTYTVTVTDGAGCFATTSTTLTQPAAALSVTLAGVSTTDCINGTVDINVSGGTGAYTYDWSNDGAETPDNDPQDLVIAIPGSYTVTVTDANGCTATLSATFTGCDKGDLPTPPYATTNADNGPSHVIVTGIKIGASVDAEADGQPNGTATGDGADEDGFVPTAPANMLVAGQTTNISIPVMNMTGGDAKLTVYIDFDNDGDLTDANEMFFTTVANLATSASLSVVVPANAVLNTNIGVRFRLTTDVAMSPTGFASNGEVEDYLVQVMGFDYGDLSDSGAGTGTGNYNTTVADNGPSHKIVPGIKLGASVDAESNGQPSTTANGDDTNDTDPTAATDDEDGVILPMFVTGTASIITVNYMNMTGGDAKLTVFIDWNKDGDFLDAGEMYSTTVANNTSSTALNVTPPMTAVLNMDLGVRVRLSTDVNASMSPTGPAPDGEVEDYVVQVMGFDYGDLADSGAGTATAPTGTPANHETLLSDNGPRHKIVTDASGNVTLKIGASVDDDIDGAPSVNAGETGGDDNTETPDDEELNAYLDAQLFIVTQTTNLSIPVMNMTGSDAKLVVYFDFNKDGDFTDMGEMFSTTVANNATTANVAVVVPGNAVVGQDLGFRIRLAGATEPMVPNGPANSGEVEDYMVQVIGYDFGDLPETYNTSGNDNPPAHIVSNDLKLGASVDAELDGAPEAMAGLMSGGDDNTPGLVTFGTSTPAGDDENGVTFVTPMVPGTQACVRVTAMNMTASAAVLQAWIDFNGNGTFEAGEQLTTGGFAPSGAAVPVGGLNNAQLCFDVPASAVFAAGGQAFVRFRLSPLGGLAPDSQTQPIPFGEIEDYKVQLGCVGNLVYEDYDFDGTQDSGEPGINGVTVSLTWLGADGVIGGGDDVTYPAVTTGTPTFQTGEYYFCGLTDGPGATDNNFKITYTTPANMTPTRTNQGANDVTDSDGAITGMNLSMTMETFAFTFPTPTTENSTGDAGAGGFGNFGDAQVDETHDQGFAFLDYGDLPETGNGDNFNSTMAEGGAVHVIVPGFKLGASVDGEQDATPNATATGDGADEDGVTFTSPLIPGNNATISVVSMNPFTAPAVLQGWIDWNNNGLLDAAEALAFTSSAVPTGNATTTYTFPVPANAIFNDGMVFARFRLSPTGGLSADGPDKFGTTPVPQGEVEDYKLNVGKVGNLVWEDRDFDGTQDAGEPGINGVTVTLQWAGADNTVGSADDVTYNPLTTGGPATVGTFDQGEYYFCGLIPGTYKVIYTTPANMTPTRTNQGSQVNGGTLDSDGAITGMDLTMTMEIFTIASVTALPTAENGLGDNGTNPTGTFPDNQVDETHDQGFAFLDYGDLPEIGGGDQFNTTMAENGAVHVIVPGFKLGAGVDGERDGAPNAAADGDDNNNTGVADDEDGVSFITPLIPGFNASISVVSMNPFTAPAVLQGWIDWNNNGLLDAAEALAFTSSAVPTGNATTTYTFPVPANAIFNDGMVFARFRLSPTGGLSADGPDKYGTAVVPQGEVEDYMKKVMCVGNIVWEDYDYDGQQDPTEPGIGGQTVQLIWGGLD